MKQQKPENQKVTTRPGDKKWIRFPAAFVLVSLAALFIFWFFQSALGQLHREVRAGAAAMVWIFGVDEAQEFECRDQDRKMILEIDGESFDWTERVLNLRDSRTEEAMAFEKYMRSHELSSLNVPSRSCRRWSEIMEIYRSEQFSLKDFQN